MTQGELFGLEFKRYYLRFWKGEIEDHWAKDFCKHFDLPDSVRWHLCDTKFRDPEVLADYLNTQTKGRFIIEQDGCTNCWTHCRDFEIFFLDPSFVLYIESNNSEAESLSEHHQTTIS